MIIDFHNLGLCIVINITKHIISKNCQNLNILELEITIKFSNNLSMLTNYIQRIAIKITSINCHQLPTNNSSQPEIEEIRGNLIISTIHLLLKRPKLFLYYDTYTCILRILKNTINPSILVYNVLYYNDIYKL